MRMPMKARFTASPVAMLIAVLALSACNGDRGTAPAPQAVTPQAKSMFVPGEAAKAMFGVVDGDYVFTFDPSKDQAFYLGPNYLSMPANSVCSLVGSGYGMSYWDQACNPETLPMTITVKIRSASSAHPQVDFFPAMRFNPANKVQLFMYVPNATQTDATNWLMQYCPTTGGTIGKCIDESLTDLSLTSYVDRTANVVFRRIKHFSGYVVTGRDSTDSGSGVTPSY